MASDLPHYTDDPMMDQLRTAHRMLREHIATFSGNQVLYAAGCSHGDWMDARPDAIGAHVEGFERHMREVQRRVHAGQLGQQQGGGHPDEHGPEA